MWNRSGSDRAATPALTYVLAIGITAILVSGLLISSSGFVDDRRESTVREELEIVGERIAASVSALDAASASGGTVSRRIEIPATILDTKYYVDLADCDGNETCLELRAADPTMDVVVTVPVENRSVVTVDRSRPRSITLVATAGTDPPLGADAEVGVSPNIGVAKDVDPGFSTSGSILGSSQALVVPGFDYGPAPPAANERITFRADVGGSGAGNLTYRWEFGDGTTLTGNESVAETVTHNYSAPGRYSVELTVEDAAGANDSVTRLLRVSGLSFANDKQVIDTDGNGDSAGVSFDIENEFVGEEITITEVFVDPADPDIDELYNDGGSGDEVVMDGTGVYDTGIGLRIEDSGSIADFDYGRTLSSGERTTVEIAEFYDDGSQVDMSGKNVTVGFRYEIEGTQRNFVSEFDINAADGGGGGTPVTGDPPVIERAVPYRDDGDLNVYLELTDDDGDLDSVTIEVLDADGDVIGTRSADLSAYSDRAEGYLPLGDDDGDAEAVRVILRDGNGNDDTETRAA